MDITTKAHGIEVLKATLRVLRPFLDDIDTTEIMVNGANDVWVEKHGSRPCKIEVSISETEIRAAIVGIASLNGGETKENTASAIVDAQFENFRVNGILAPPAMRGPALCIRKHGHKILSLEEYVSKGVFSAATASRMTELVRAKKNMVVAGSTGSGKTTLVNALLAMADPHDRFFTIEDVPELKIASKNWVSVMSNAAMGLSAEKLLKAALRQRPDRIILGEVRDDAAYDLLNAANTGHDGCVATLHASSAADALMRLENMVMQRGIPFPLPALRYQIAAAFDVLMFIRKEDNGPRRLVELLEIEGYDRDLDHYKFHYHVVDGKDVDQKAEAVS